MARVAGRAGRLYLGIASDTAAAESILYISKWSINFQTDQFEVTALGDTNKTYVAGLPDAQGSFSGFWDTATASTYTASTDGLARRMYLYPTTPSNTGPYFFGTVFPDFSIEGDVGGPVSLSGDFVAASPVTKIG